MSFQRFERIAMRWPIHTCGLWTNRKPHRSPQQEQTNYYFPLKNQLFAPPIHTKMDVLQQPAEEFDNDQMVEELWAMKAFEHADVYFNLLCSVDPRGLRLTPYDDEIYTAFRLDFPNLDVRYIDENEIKSPEGKTKWRAFIEKFNKVEDFSYGTLIRADSSKEFGPDNSVLVIRIQFWALEIARNREGHNDHLRALFKSTKSNGTAVEEVSAKEA